MQPSTKSIGGSGTTFGVIPNQRNDEGLVVIAEITDAETNCNRNKERKEKLSWIYLI